MGSLVSIIVASLYMKFMELHTIATTPVTCASHSGNYMWKYLEIIKKGQDYLTQHLNQADATGNIKFTYEEEKGNTFPNYIDC